MNESSDNSTRINELAQALEEASTPEKKYAIYQSAVSEGLGVSVFKKLGLHSGGAVIAQGMVENLKQGTGQKPR